MISKWYFQTPKTGKDFCSLGKRKKSQRVRDIEEALSLALPSIISKCMCMWGVDWYRRYFQRKHFLHVRKSLRQCQDSPKMLWEDTMSNHPPALSMLLGWECQGYDTWSWSAWKGLAMVIKKCYIGSGEWIR